MTHDDELRSRVERLAATHDVADLTVDEIIERRSRGRTRRRFLAVAAVLALVVASAGVVRLLTGDGGSEADVASGTDDTAEEEVAEPTATTTVPPVGVDGAGDDAFAASSYAGGPDWIVPWGDGFLAFGQVFEPSEVTIQDLVPDIESRLPQAVVDALADAGVTGIPESIEVLQQVGLLDEATAVFEADPELLDAYYQVQAGGTFRFEASVSPDGEDWSVLGGFALPGGSEYVNLVQSDGEHLVVVEQLWDEAGGQGEITVSTTSDLTAWTSVTIPATSADVPDYVESDTYPNSLAIGAGGWYLSVITSGWVDLWALMPADIRAEFEAAGGFGWSADAEGVLIETYDEEYYGDEQFAEGPLIEGDDPVAPPTTTTTTTTTVPAGDVPPASAVETRLVPWTELGITYADYERYAVGEAQSAAAFRGTWDGAIAPATPPAEGECCSVIGTDAGFIAQSWGVWDETTGSSSPSLYFSADGNTWTEIAGPAGAQWVNALAAVEGGVVASDDAGTVWRAAADGTGWTTVDIPGLPDTTNIWFNQQGGRGVATVIDVASYDYDYDQVPYEVTIEHDGFEIRIDSESDGTSRVRLTELATGEVVLDEVIDPFSDGIPDFLVYENLDEEGDIGFAGTDGEIIVTVPMSKIDEATSQAEEQAAAESGFVEPEYEYEPDFWLVATSDGLTWYVEDLDETTGEPSFGQAAINGDTVVIRDWESGWVTFAIG